MDSRSADVVGLHRGSQDIDVLGPELQVGECASGLSDAPELRQVNLFLGNHAFLLRFG
jgi:hypothetical protein